MKFLVVFTVLSIPIVAAGVFRGPLTVNTTLSYSSATPVPTPTPDAGTDEQTPRYSSYRGVTIRMPAAQVTEKLGTPTHKSKAGDYYAISPTESVQISYDTEQAVKAISINITGDLKSAPTPKDVVGTDVKKDSEGTISKLVSYPKSGFWISYIRTGGMDATIIITLQKIAIQ